ncbi:Deoxyguanosinetriphosphate triphosphohydrolase-like protein [Desulfonema limicola]|uniref:Deoxyguanosinetriphosphate triphosphohydrolase-like protein n=1 Tax=Desulfonema limicola TaxID=45656 RepID=A0A975B9S4_9BACT|nr:HD domain-containing protein [Desulfonema limicola]QTA81604.1 Deoxyguanosinetriphosphate triphosphohydrolase-like protein [Desulfonema limicola]
MHRYLNPEKLKNFLNQREKKLLSSLAVFSCNGVRRIPETEIDTGYRQAFSLDADRILHSLAYTRYIDKTQVFYLVKNDHITHRVLHVQLVSKIARTIGRFLGLNEDIIEAIALGHDLGHAPFGHEGEGFLSDLCKYQGIGSFCHNVQSVQFLDKAERKGRGLNLCLQTLDGILCHDGEVHNQAIKPEKDKNFETLDKETAEKKADNKKTLVPMTLEGCVVRFSDTIAYIGRDIEDAIRLNLVKRSDIPGKSSKILGNTNGTIVYNLVTDIIKNSFEHQFISFSQEISEALKRLKKFNYEKIYMNPRIKKYSNIIQKSFEVLFYEFLEDIQNNNHDSVIFTQFLADMSESYIINHSDAEIVRDFIAGMTDNYFLRQLPKGILPDNLKI